MVGAGTAGLATAILLARAGAHVEVLERAPEPGPVGAGLLLQPTGMGVLARLGVLERVEAGAARIDRIVGTTVRGRRFMDMAYRGEHGLGVHRGALFSALCDAAVDAGVRVIAGAEIVDYRPEGVLTDARGRTHGPYDLVVGADGARSTMRRFLDVRARVYEHRWGALWGVFDDPGGVFGTELDQYFDGASRMAGFLPTGSGAVSLFWSVRLDRVAQVRAAGMDAFRRELVALAPVAETLDLGSMDTLLEASYRQISLPRWHAGRLVVLGDAAHALSPQLGQGANLALMDAAALADADSLAAFEASRRAQARFYAFGARSLNTVFQSDCNAMALPRDLLFPVFARMFPGRALAVLSGRATGPFSSIGA
ncbi:FAD-dependent monooxygenase [Solirubrobacter sp. CPCC 204708]|uniref:FAD-dependent monooxygenase n=1 Tax=Solirubrobacter deserti TaxID=2282478 RepID=A0ABT4RHV6_9ACTN|nr:NAD(P)/FAD-dependent oxidoreductase [Solirubrobacter deserti]MBE2315192.1 FAD-dependent monooxygenase [Solirubrobacter deserti]MDA0137875.1 FAD-dependent monooxygenase [Solirubrobacter deserti]